ncbi:hypothetical protein P280DRAFT_551436 [Massarina eburnea CBS 473.64]|uniref:Uncharacterized protein n=1 Tax=Massarina eburnea CBS 473.64 TaxID=1395130 RepID=A0A6A6RV75_9PLEO|nr:hypothetical protein P280DRAFT_551436 [Massarina eburnea CBS 473.64]
MFGDLGTCIREEGFVCGPSFGFKPDADIAGAGVFAAFSTAAFASLVGAAISLVMQRSQYFGKKRTIRKHALAIRRISEAFLISLSDTQIVTSLALLIPTLFWLSCTISAYHYNLVCNLVLISSASHIVSIVVMHKYFGQNRKLGVLRCVMVTANLGFAWVLFYRRNQSTIFPSAKPNSNIPKYIPDNGTLSTGLSLPSACYLGHPNAPASGYANNFTSSPDWLPSNTNTTNQIPSNVTVSNNSSLAGHHSSFIPSTNVTWTQRFEQFSSNDNLTNTGDVVSLAFITASFFLAIGTSLLLSIKNVRCLPHKRRHQVAYIFRCISFLTSYGIMIYGFSQFLELRNWMGKSQLFGRENDEYEIRSFGQLMPIGLLILPVLAFVEQFADRESQSKDEEQILLRNHEGYLSTGE